MSDKAAVESRIPERLLGPTFLAKMAEVDPDDLLNPRAIFSGIEALAKGQKNADTGGNIVLYKHRTPKAGFKWELAAGGRSFKARRINGTVEFEAREFIGAWKELRFYTGTSNLGRQDMTSYEKAAWFHGMKKEFKFTNEQLHNELTNRGVHISLSHVANLVAAYEKLIPQIREAWKNQATGGENIAVPDSFVFFVYSKEPELQLKIWERVNDGERWEAVRAELSDTGTVGGKKSGKAKRGKKSNEPTVNVRQLRAIIEAAAISDESRQNCLRLIRFITGEDKTLRIDGRMLAVEQRGRVSASATPKKNKPAKKATPKPTPKRKS